MFTFGALFIKTNLIQMKKIYLLFAVALLLNVKAFSQCAPSVVYTTSAWYESTDLTTPYSGYVCNGFDSLVTRNDNGWYYYDGDGFAVKLVAGGQYRIAIDSATAPSSITVSDSLGTAGTPIAGAFAAAAGPYNSLIFTAGYTGVYYIVVNENGVCGGAGSTNLASGSVKLINSANCPNIVGLPNDDICGAYAMNLNVTYASNTTNASSTDAMDANVAAAGYACSTPNNTLWYTFTPTGSGNYDISTTSPTGGLDMWVGLFSGTSVCTDPLTYINCLRAAASGAAATNLVTLNAGTTYYLMVDGFSGSIGAFDITILPNGTIFPANDTICGAITLIPGVVYSGDNTDAAPTDPLDAAVFTAGFACSAPNNTLWYTYTANFSGDYLIETNSSATTGLDGWIGVFEAANCSSALTAVGDTCYKACSPGAPATNTVNLVAGSTYFFMIDGFSGAVGDFTITINPDPNGIKKIATAKNIEIFPNPSNGDVTLTTAANSTDILIINALGEVIFNQSKLNAGKHQIDLKNLAQGVYQVKAINGASVDVKKITITH